MALGVQPIAAVAARRASCLACPARSATICAALPEAAIDRVALIKLLPRRLPAGAVIFAEGDPCTACFTVLEGWVALVASAEAGTQVVLDYALPGNYFGFVRNPAASRAHGAVALTAVRLCPLPCETALALLATEAPLAKRLAHLTALHEARVEERLISALQRSARSRIARLLLALCFRQTGALPATAGQVVTLPLTQLLIGETVGLTAEHVSRTLNRLAVDGVLRLRRRRLTVLDPLALIAAAGVAERPLVDMVAPA